MALLTRQDLDKDGVVDLDAAAAAAATGGDAYPNDDRSLFVMSNGDASAHTATFAAPSVATYQSKKFGELTTAALSIAVPAGKVGAICVPQGYNNADGHAVCTYDAVTSVKVAAFRVFA